jgi:hypothetical protein
MLRNDLRTVVEARCASHGRSGASANFTACLLCCIACEMLSELTAPPRVSGAVAKRQNFFERIGALVDDPRYAALGEIVHRGFRHGIAHTFLPKHTGDVACSVMWLCGSSNQISRCVELLAASPEELRVERAEWHLRFDNDILTVVPQILYLDVIALLDDVESKLKAGTAPLSTDVARNFPRWWRETTVFRDPLPEPEAAIVAGSSPVPLLRVARYFELSNGTVKARAWLERSPGDWQVHFDNAGTVSIAKFSNREDARDHAAALEVQLVRQGFL